MEREINEVKKKKLKLDLTFTTRRCEWCDQEPKEQAVKRKILNEAVLSYLKKIKQILIKNDRRIQENECNRPGENVD